MMLVQVHDVSVCCDVEISQYVASIMFALIRCLIGDAGGQASGGAHAERADKQHQGRSACLQVFCLQGARAGRTAGRDPAEQTATDRNV
jgi:hypothetical protein